MQEDSDKKKRARVSGVLMIAVVLLCAVGADLLVNRFSAVNKGARLLIGTYTDSGSYGVYSASFDGMKGKLTLIDSAQAGNPSFIVASEDGTRAYSVNEYNDGRQGVTAYRIDGYATLSVLNSQPLGPGWGEDPCNVLLAGGKMISSDYTGGDLAAFPLEADGSLAPVSGVFRWEGGHIHCAALSPDGKYIFVVDLGGDRIYRFSDTLEDSTVAWQGPEGLGPRHLVFDRKGTHAYLLCELSDSLVVFDCREGVLSPVQTVSAYDGGGHGSADIHLSPDGRFLYTSHRLAGDGVAIFRVLEDGRVERAGFLPTGKHPRNFAVSPDGKWLLVACRDSDSVEVYPLSRGIPGGKAFTLHLSAPVCLSWFGTK